MKQEITFEEFAKVELRVGEIVGAVIPEGSEKLLQFRVDFGPASAEAESRQGREIRTIFSGVKEWYSPEELVGVKTVWVTNIPTKKTPFGESQGMLFACDQEDGKPYVLRVEESVPNGSVFH